MLGGCRVRTWGNSETRGTLLGVLILNIFRINHCYFHKGILLFGSLCSGPRILVNPHITLGPEPTTLKSSEEAEHLTRTLNQILLESTAGFRVYGLGLRV